MDDNRIEIVASLDIPKTVSTIEKDLEEVKKRLDANKALSITCSLDTNSLATLQNQVSEISKKLKIDIPKIEIQAGTGQSAQNIENVAKSVETVTNKVLTLKKTLADLDSRFVEAFKAVENPDGIINAERTMATIQSRLSSLGTVTVTGKYNDQESADSINKIIARIEAASGEVRELNFLLDATGQKFEYIGGSYSDKGVSKIQQDLARLSKELANFEASHKSIESGLIEPLTVARNAIIDLESGVGSVESAQKALDNLKTSAAEIGVNLKSTGSSFNVFDNASNKAKNFDNIIKGLELDINNLNQESNKSNLSNSLDEARQKLQQLQDVESQFGKGVEWSKNYKEVSELLQTIANDLKVVQREENKAFQDNNRVANLQNRIKRLTADINSYAAANKRAVESTKQMSSGRSFADEWSRITTEMAKGADLTDRELKDLSADMAVFRKEAQAAGLAGESAFGKFLNSFKTMSSYITANMVFNVAKRQLSQMIEEVKAVDTAMVELRKVTTATEYEFQEFAKSATKTGIELGASVSDVINATSTFSRAGFNLPDAEELGKIATLYKNVGDGITIDSASESIISVMKAFNIEAENSIGIIDRINEVSNRAAIDSGGLGLALQRVASAMDAANNSLDETIALTTASNEIVQNPEMVAQGWRTVALRIRGAKSELEDAGLETEGMVESTAKLRDLIKSISGVDIMRDENTFKSTYQIIDELGRVWNKISDINQASLLEAIAGRFYLNVQKCA